MSLNDDESDWIGAGDQGLTGNVLRRRNGGGVWEAGVVSEDNSRQERSSHRTPYQTDIIAVSRYERRDDATRGLEILTFLRGQGGDPKRQSSLWLFFPTAMLLSHGIAGIFLVDDALRAAPVYMWTTWIAAAVSWLTYLVLVSGCVDPGTLPIGGATFAKELASVNPAAKRQLALLKQHSREFGLMPRDQLGEDGLPEADCKTCQLQRPLRAGHCRATGRCYARFDHACWWVGQPVAAGNHRTFVVFVASMVVQLWAGGGALWEAMQWPGLMTLVGQAGALPLLWLGRTISGLMWARDGSDEEDRGVGGNSTVGGVAGEHRSMCDSGGCNRLPEDWVLAAYVSHGTFAWLRWLAAVYVAVVVLAFGAFVTLLLLEQGANIASDQTVRETLKGRVGGGSGFGTQGGDDSQRQQGKDIPKEGGSDDRSSHGSGSRRGQRAKKQKRGGGKGEPAGGGVSEGDSASDRDPQKDRSVRLAPSPSTLAASKWAREHPQTRKEVIRNCLRFWLYRL